jgi:hypothetical protein
MLLRPAKAAFLHRQRNGPVAPGLSAGFGTRLVFAVLAFSALAACSGPASPGAPTHPADAAPDAEWICPPTPSTCPHPKAPPSYATDVRPIITSRCAPCHFPGGISSRIYDFSTYEDVVNATTPILSQLIPCNMPPIHGNAQYGIEAGTVPGLSAEQRQTFVAWIRCGAPDN